MTALANTLDALFAAGVAPNGAGAGSRAKAPGMLAQVSNSSGVLYEASHGVMNAESGEPLGIDGIFYIASMTKAITGAAVMQLVEQGTLSLDDPAEKVLPELGAVQVLQGLDAAGKPQLRAPKSKITLRQLLTHTSGFGYETWNQEMLDYVRAMGLPERGRGMRADLDKPLLFDPGERWNYSIAIDWAGLMLEAVTGKTLGAYMAENIFAPIGMVDTGFTVPEAKRSRQMSMHQRQADGSLQARQPMPQPTGDMDRGGGGLFSTVPDYGAFIRMILNKGTLNGNQVLKPETVAEMSRNNIGALRTVAATSALPELSNDFEFLPGTPKSWGLTFQIAMEDAPGMRSAGSLSWAGLTNCYYWIDPAKDIAGVYASQVFPFVDAGSHGLFVAMEKAVYAALNG